MGQYRDDEHREDALHFILSEVVVYIPQNYRILSVLGSFQSRSKALNLTRKYFTKKARKPFDKTDLKIFKGIKIFKGQKHVSQMVDKRI